MIKHITDKNQEGSIIYRFSGFDIRAEYNCHAVYLGMALKDLLSTIKENISEDKYSQIINTVLQDMEEK